MNAKIKDVEIRQATAADITLFYPKGCPRTAYAWLALYQGKPACLAGLIVERFGCTAFSDILPGIAAPKITIWRTACALMEHIKALGLPMMCGCETADRMARKFVERLGFIYNRPYQGMELYLWRKWQQ